MATKQQLDVVLMHVIAVIALESQTSKKKDRSENIVSGIKLTLRRSYNVC